VDPDRPSHDSQLNDRGSGRIDLAGVLALAAVDPHVLLAVLGVELVVAVLAPQGVLVRPTVEAVVPVACPVCDTTSAS